MSTQNILDIADTRFGPVLNILLTESEPFADFYFVACRRNDAPIKERPYMTITARVEKQGANKGHVSFFWGHYDLDYGKMHEAYIKARPTQR